jgi:OOP family OmpA-OmpF porin
MRITSTRQHATLALACALALGAFSTAAGAQHVNADEKALLVNSQGGAITSGSGDCWHMAFGPAPQWTAACHPAPVAQYVAPVASPAPAPAAKPVVVMAAAAPLVVYEKVAFDANVLFDSDKSSLRTSGREKLDQFVGRIHGLEAQNIRAVGYADRMGSAGDNQILSEERVEVVKTYLVTRGVAASRVRTSAFGDTRPDTALADCKDANNAKNVACMQPDRHVTIEVSGTRKVAQ